MAGKVHNLQYWARVLVVGLQERFTKRLVFREVCIFPWPGELLARSKQFWLRPFSIHICLNWFRLTLFRLYGFHIQRQIRILHIQNSTRHIKHHLWLAQLNAQHFRRQFFL